MNIRLPAIVSATLILAMVGMSLWAATVLPPGTRMPIHFAMNGAPDGFASTQIGLSILPLVALAVSIVLAIVPRIEPRRDNLARSAGAYAIAWIAVVGLLVFLHGLIVYTALAPVHHLAPLDIGRMITLLVGALFVAIGSQMHKVRSNFMFGIRTPWTLSDDRVWEGTHRMGRWICVAAGLALVIAALVARDPRVLNSLTIIVVLGMVVTLVIASYVLWRLRNHEGRS